MSASTHHSATPDVMELMDYEQGELGATATVELFARLVATGLAWQLQGHYGRTAAGMIDAGILTSTGEVTEYARERLASAED